MASRTSTKVASIVLAALVVVVVVTVLLPTATLDAVAGTALQALGAIQSRRLGLLQIHAGFIRAIGFAALVAPVPVAMTAVLGRHRRWRAFGIGAIAVALAVVVLAVRTGGDTLVQRTASLVVASVVGYGIGMLVTAAWCALSSRNGPRLAARASGTSRRVALGLTAVYLLVVAAIAFHQTPVDSGSGRSLYFVLWWLMNHGMPSWIDYDTIEFTANIVYFVPLGLLVVLLFGGRTWWLAGLAGFFASASIEVAQALFLPERFASVDDVVANTSGAVLGALLGVVVLGLMAHHRLRQHDPAYGLRA